jgi:citrate lyase subunit beta/citryl-CoA lyase
MFENLDSILFPNEKPLPSCSACDHYAGHEKLILKSIETQKIFKGSFDITCDLEDGASVGQETALRQLFLNIISSSENVYKKIGVRIHDPLSSHFSDDLNFVAKNLFGIISHLTIPKILSFEQGQKVIDTVIDTYKKECDTSKVSIPPIHFLIETPKAVEEVWQIASLPLLRGLDFGCMDFVSFHHGALSDKCFQSPEQFEHPILMRAKSRLVAACLGNNIIPAHNVTVDYKNPDSAYDDALRARHHFGFLRMWSIHPNQIQPILNAMSPSAEEVDTAKEILTLAKNAQWAPISYKDRLHDRASFRYYWNVLKRVG